MIFFHNSASHNVIEKVINSRKQNKAITNSNNSIKISVICDTYFRIIK